MKKFLIAVASALFLTFAPMAAHAECFPIADAKSEVAKWDTAAVWEYLMDGDKYDALVAWAKLQGYSAKELDGILIVYAVSDGKKVVIWGLSPNGQCVEIAGSWKMTIEQFNDIIGKVV